MGIEIENRGMMKRSFISYLMLGYVVYFWAALGSGCSGKKSENNPVPRDGGPSHYRSQVDSSALANDGGGDSATGYNSGQADSGCVHVGPPIMDVRLLDPCPLCKNARCVAPGVVAAEDVKLLATCEDGVNKCVPDYYLETGGRLLLKTCVSLGRAEGRCVSLCVPEVSAQKDRLPRDVCAQDELCAPCYDPVTGEDTRSCRVGCDPGPQHPPLIFSACCHGIGSCVPRSAVDKEFLDLLGVDTCKEKDTLCAPKSFIDPSGFVPESCSAVGGGEGRCIPSCVPMVAEQADRLQQDSCPEYHLCAPCYDPVTGNATGACTLSNDPGPQEPAVVFPECCGGLSVCVPTELVPESQRSMLAKDSCADSDHLCVPKEVAQDPLGFVPPSCDSWYGAEARCLPACLPRVAHEAPRIAQETCPDGYLCAPCYDHVSGEETPSCHVAGDPGPTEEPIVFDRCCGGLSSCVLVEIVPDKNESSLAVDSCTKPNVLCVPYGAALDPLIYIPTKCFSWNGAEGRCLPACLPDLAAKTGQLDQGVCVEPGCDCEKAGYLCAPCFDPVTGEETGACSMTPADQPADEPYTFPECCESSAGSGVFLSVCVPDALVPDDKESMLSGSECSEPHNLCAPKQLASDPTGWVPDKCRSWGNGEGRCLPACLPDVAARAGQLSKGTCVKAGCDCQKEGYLCAPCYDPVSGKSTRACDVTAADAPVNPPYTFPRCCNQNGNYRGTCVPSALAGDQAASLPDGGCGALGPAAEKFVCAPNERVSDPNYAFPTCTYLGSAGVCLADCFSPKSSGSLQGDCPNSLDECLPCAFGGPC